MRTKSPARPPLARTSSLQGTASTSSSARRSEEEAAPSIKEEKEKETKSYSSYSSYSSESKSSRLSSLAPISEAKSSRLSTEDKGDKAEAATANGKPPKPPSRLKLSSKLLDIKETPKEEKPKKNILSLKVRWGWWFIMEEVHVSFAFLFLSWKFVRNLKGTR